MRSRVLLAVVVAALALAPVASAGDVVVGIDRSHVSTSLGRSFSFTTTVSNRGTGPTGTLVAHLNVLSLKPGVYVDPEDWSAERTHNLDPIPPGGSRSVGWRVKAVKLRFRRGIAEDTQHRRHPPARARLPGRNRAAGIQRPLPTAPARPVAPSSCLQTQRDPRLTVAAQRSAGGSLGQELSPNLALRLSAPATGAQLPAG